VSDGDGSTGGDLSRERGHDTAGTAEHVTEAHGQKLCSGVPSRGYLPINFTQPLCRSQDACGFDRFVARNEDEALDCRTVYQPMGLPPLLFSENVAFGTTTF